MTSSNGFIRIIYFPSSATFATTSVFDSESLAIIVDMPFFALTHALTHHAESFTRTITRNTILQYSSWFGIHSELKIVVRKTI